jgi:hypothetical protein
VIEGLVEEKNVRCMARKSAVYTGHKTHVHELESERESFDERSRWICFAAYGRKRPMMEQIRPRGGSLTLKRSSTREKLP